MSYILHGRQISLFLPANHGEEVPPSPCIFCGVTCCHINDGGTGWLVGAIPDRGPEQYLYHGSPMCDAAKQDVADNPPHGSIWRCGCVADYVENVGGHCHACGKPRAECAAYPSVMSCPRCGASDLPAREPGGVIQVRCGGCGAAGHFDSTAAQVVLVETN